MANELFSAEDLTQLTLIAAKLMLDAHARKRSMVKIEVDPKNLFKLSGKETAGKMFIVVAGGPSIDVLKSSIALAENPH